MPPAQPRIPPTEGGIQFHFCRNLSCKNFGVQPSEVKKWERQAQGEGFKLSGGGTSAYTLLCRACGTSLSLKSNLALAQELERLWAPLRDAEISCPNDECRSEQDFVASGRTGKGTQRYKCKRCGKTFTAKGRKSRKTKRAEVDVLVLKLLMNKSPMRRICEATDTAPAALYNQIERSHALAVSFASKHERKLLEQVNPKRVYLAIDRQEYIFNWGSSLDRRNVVLRAIASADNSTGYVMGMHLDFDPGMEAELVERAAVLANDYDLPPHLRTYARVWLQREYRDRYFTQRSLDKSSSRHGLEPSIARAYTQQERDREAELSAKSAEGLPDNQLPSHGMQVHSEYTLYAHFLFLEKLLRRVEKVRIFMDQDAGMKIGCVGAFAKRIQEATADAFYVSIAKEMTVPQKKALKSKAEIQLRKAMQDLKLEDRNAAIKLIMIQRLREMVTLGGNGDQWLMHPFPDMSEPEKAVCYLTDRKDLEIDHLAALYRKASLHSVDKFFMQLRRRISILERPIRSSNASRSWYGYAAYNPSVAMRLIELFRIVHNYILVGEDHLTPAMRLGLADKVYQYEDLLQG
jgi:transposase-like protein